MKRFTILLTMLLALTGHAKDMHLAITENATLQTLTALEYCPEVTRVHKFGYNNAIGTDPEPFSTSGLYRTPTNMVALEIVSSSALDEPSANGAHKVVVQGISTNWLEVTEEVTLNGTTAVDLANAYYRVYIAYVSETGTYASQSAPSHAGILTIREGGGGDVWALIADNTGGGFFVGQTQIGAYTVPKGRTAYVPSKFVTIESTKVVDVFMFQRPNADDVTPPFTGAMRVVQQHKGSAGGFTVNPDGMIGPFVGPCDLGFMGEVSSGTGAASVDFEIFMVPTEED